MTQLQKHHFASWLPWEETFLRSGQISNLHSKYPLQSFIHSSSVFFYFTSSIVLFLADCQQKQSEPAAMNLYQARWPDLKQNWKSDLLNCQLLMGWVLTTPVTTMVMNNSIALCIHKLENLACH